MGGISNVVKCRNCSHRSGKRERKIYQVVEGNQIMNVEEEMDSQTRGAAAGHMKRTVLTRSKAECCCTSNVRAHSMKGEQ